MNCKAYKVLYKVIPVNKFRGALLGRHFTHCPACSRELAEDRELETVFPGQREALAGIDLWPGIKKEITSAGRSRARKSLRLRPVFAAAGLLGLFLILPLLLFRGGRGTAGISIMEGKENGKIVVKSLEVEERPAKSFYFKSSDKNKLILWVQKS